MDVIDPQEYNFEAIGRWIDARLAAINATDLTPEIIATFAPFELNENFDGPFGAEASPEWRRFFLGILLADWACYERPVDRVDFPRLKYIMSSASQYFRLWCITLPDGKVTPVGYSAGYPIPKYIFEGAIANSGNIDDRGAFMPQRFVRPDDMRYGYIMNVSIISQLRNTTCSQRVLRAMQRDGKRFNKVNFLAVTVDEAGKRFSRLAKFDHARDITVQGTNEGLFVRRST